MYKRHSPSVYPILHPWSILHSFLLISSKKLLPLLPSGILVMMQHDLLQVSKCVSGSVDQVAWQ
jgi:hypothetical protein